MPNSICWYRNILAVTNRRWKKVATMRTFSNDEYLNVEELNANDIPVGLVSGCFAAADDFVRLALALLGPSVCLGTLGISD